MNLHSRYCPLLYSFANCYAPKIPRVDLGPVTEHNDDSFGPSQLDEFQKPNLFIPLVSKHFEHLNVQDFFVLYKKEASRVEKMLQSRGWNAQALHGGNSLEFPRNFPQFSPKFRPIFVGISLKSRCVAIGKNESDECVQRWKRSVVGCYRCSCERTRHS